MRIVCGAAGLLALFASLWLSNTGFQRVLDFRMLERIPLTSVVGALPGEVQLKGTAVAEETHSSPHTHTASIYYRYLVEKEVRDSDGNRSWRTERDEQRAKDFTLLDHTGEASIIFNFSVNDMEINVPQYHQSESGGYRYTEWILRPNATVTLYGWMEDKQTPTINFYASGDYLPILTTFGAAAQRSDIGFSAIFWMWGGVTTIIFSCLMLMTTLRIHRTLVFLVAVSAASGLLLVHLGLKSLEDDVTTGYRQVTTHFERSQLARSEAQKNESAIMNQLLRTRYLSQISQFPESWYAKAQGLDNPPALSLTDVQQAIAQSRAAEFMPTEVPQAWWIAPLFLVVAAFIAWLAFAAIRVKRIQENIPTSLTAGVTYGLNEVEGELTAESTEDLLTGPVSHQDACWYRYLIQERRGTGKNRRWVTISDDIKKQPFLVKDREGTIRVFPGKAEVITKHSKSRREGNRKYTEWRLSPGDEIYLLGKARLDKTRGDTLVFGHEKDAPYIIANIPETEVMLKKSFKGMGLLSVGASIVFLVAIWLGAAGGGFSSIDFLKAAAISPFMLSFIVLAMMYNDLVFLRERCDRNWANIQVSLKKRADLIPQLQSVVAEYFKHEKHLQTGLALLRERSNKVDSSQDMDRYMAAEHTTISELSARIEQYPDLKGTQLIADFHRRLIKLENEVALIRAGFNDAVNQYRTRLQTFPDNMLAKLFRFKPRTHLEFDDSAHEIPKVALTTK